MSRPACRVFFTEHDDGKLSGVVMRRSTRLFDPAPPAAWGTSVEEVLTVLAPMVLAIDDDDRERYLFTEAFELRRVAIDVHPRTAAGQAWVVGTRTIPLRLGFAAYAEGEAFRVLVPRFGWALVLERLEDAGEILSHAIFASTMGATPASIFDYRPAVREWIEPWSVPALLETSARRDLDGHEDVPNLAAVAEEWTTKLARRLLPAPVGEPAELDRLTAALDADPPRSILLVGESGVGKTALVRRAARHLLLGSRKGKPKRRLWATSASAITAGMMYLGMWQERCLAIAAELNGTDDWLYLDRLVDILIPESDGSCIGDLWAAAVAAGELRLIAECSEAELTRARRKHPGLIDGFTVIRIDEPAADVVLPMAVAFQERKDGAVELHPAALRRMLDLLGAFRRDQRFPGKLFAFLEWWNAAGLLAAPRSPERSIGSGAEPAPDLQGGRGAEPTVRPKGPPRAVRPGDVAGAFARWSGLPIELITDERPTGRAAIARALTAGVIGQDAACDVVAKALLRFKTGLDDPERPVAALLFAGPTGVGKTELAKQIARYLFGDVARMVRVDLSEYMTPGSAGRLLEVGRGTTSLAEQVRRQPLTVVLLDELEKAHAEVFDVLLGVLGEGRLTDSMGRLVDFRMAVIVMTTNLGALSSSVGFGGGGGPDHAAAIRAHFRPELIGRLDQVVAFAPLGRADIERIVELELAKLRQRPGLPARNLTLWLSPAARAQLAARGHDPKLGARPLRRLIEEQVVAPLAIRLAADPELRDGSIGVVTADEARAAGDQLVIALPA